MKSLLCVIHAPSENTKAIKNAVFKKLENENLSLEIKYLNPFEANASHVLDADGLLIGTTENLASMAGSTKDFFDRTYNELIFKKEGLPVAAWVRAGHDGTGTVNQINSIVNGLKWRMVQEIIVCKGTWEKRFLEECINLSLSFAHGIESNIF